MLVTFFFKKNTYVYKEQCLVALNNYKAKVEFSTLSNSQWREVYAKTCNGFKPITIFTKIKIGERVRLNAKKIT